MGLVAARLDLLVMADLHTRKSEAYPLADLIWLNCLDFLGIGPNFLVVTDLLTRKTETYPLADLIWPNCLDVLGIG